jgi:cell division protein FtsI/penicillin-binding protein 2
LGRRIRFFRLVLVLAFLGIVARLVYVQVFEASGYGNLAGQELAQRITVPAHRGTIYDRDGAVLAMSVPTANVVADDFQVVHPEREALALAPLLGVPAARLLPLLSERSGYVVLAKGLSTSKASVVAAKGAAGITLIDSSERVTADGDLASPVVGTVHQSGTGASGLEYEFNKALSGTPGSETLLESPGGVTLPGTPVTDQQVARAGTGLELTLDQQLQYTTEQDLAAQIVSTHATSGIAEVMDVRTGDILSMANLVANDSVSKKTSSSSSTPAATDLSAKAITIGPKGPVDDAPSNLAVTQLYEPGSVFKLVTFSAALADGVISPNSSFSVPDQRTLDGSVFHDAEVHPTEQLSATQILAQSSNIGTSEIAGGLGEQRLLGQVSDLGFGRPTGLGFPGEESGLLANAADWEPTDYVSLAIGQVDAVTAQQVLDAYNAVANGGVLVSPRLVQATVAPDGKSTPLAEPQGRRVIPATTDHELTSMLEQVVSTGTGTNAFIPGYTVAGKTGTAQIPTAGGAGYVPGAYMATFVGMAPATHPVLAAIVVLNRPTPIFGGTVSAPVFSQVMGYALHRYDIPTTPGAPTTPPPPGTVASTGTQDVT